MWDQIVLAFVSTSFGFLLDQSVFLSTALNDSSFHPVLSQMTLVTTNAKGSVQIQSHC